MDTEQQCCELSRATMNATLDRIAIVGRNYFFKDITLRTRFVQSLLIIAIVLWGAAVYSGVIERQLLVDMAQGAFASEEEEAEAAYSSDIRQEIIGFSQTILFIVVLIFFMMWVHRSNNNIRALTGRGLQFTPAWAVGWFFVPIGFFWKPYQAIKEIWQVSSDHCGLSSCWSHAFVGYWWSSWLLSSVLGNFWFKLQITADGLDDMILASSVSIVCDVADIITSFLTFVLISRIYTMHNLIKANTRGITEVKCQL